jgi:hypothetical protein
VIDGETRQRAVAWLARAEELLQTLAPYVDSEVIEEARRLAGFGEAPIGLGLVGWEIANRGAPVPRELIRRLIQLTDGCLERGIDIPSSLLEFAID